ncbi:MAG: hypothetical protein ISEC1_P0438 [Thiomicrorhabdus sp.]|nr:MAG: hypothetical protein ISEC1_P0438 [Thiomicrorhabdus sp.]
MDLNQIYYFITVVECGSYTKAAQRLSIPKSTLSRHIQALEDNVQVRLLNRSTRKLSLTKAGESFFNKSLPQVTHLQNIYADISQYHKDVTGHLRVTMPTEVGTCFLNKVLPKFLAQHPKIKLELDFSTSNQNLIEQGFDLAIRIGKLEDSSYIAKRIASPKLSLYASPDYLLSKGTLNSLDEINQHHHIIMGFSKGYLHIKGQEPVLRQNYQLSTNSMTFNKMMCMEGHGIAFLPDALCESGLQSGRLVKVLDGTPFEQPNIYAVYPSRSHPSKALSTFINFVTEEITDLNHMS